MTPARSSRARLARLSAGASVAAITVLLVLDAVFPFPHAALRRSPALVVEAADGSPLRVFLPADGIYRLPVRIDEVAPTMVETLVASEDRWFWWHPGVNPGAIVRAGVANLRAGRVVSGASTIPMQIARLTDPKPRTLAGKIEEAFRALQLEWHYSKRELLELYLNLTPYGGNLEGVGAAAAAYFGKEAAQLSLGEAALLTALPRSPTAYNPRRYPEQAGAARARVLRQLERRGEISAAELSDALRHPVPGRRHATPFRAPHLARMIAARAPAGAARSRAAVDPEVQRIAERSLASRIAEYRQGGVGNGAVVVIENNNRAVRALVGSAGFHESAFQGQVNGALARRSPGSALKPFLYALAIEDGRMVPDSYLLDVPTDFAGYVAENYDDRYRGRVMAAEALRQSLNAPAVRLLAATGLENFYSLLREGGLGTLDRPAVHYGLPLVLGSGEVTLLDLTNLYAALAKGGQFRPYRLEAGENVAAPTRLFSAEAAYLITAILSGVERPDMPEAWQLTHGAPAVAWKTGTSYGHRDAWAIGYSRRYTIGVWVGNLDGTPRKGISGAQHAGPLLFELFRAIEGRGARLDTPRGLDIDWTRVCAESHQLPGPYCTRTTSIATIPGTTRLTACPLHRRVFVDAETGERLSGDCLATRPHRARVLSVYPAELIAWRRAVGQLVTTVPPVSRACNGIPSSAPPRIVSPDSSTSYLLRAAAPTANQRLALTASVGAGVQRLFWYQDGALVASGTPAEPLFLEPVRGEHEIVLVDDTGRADTVRYRVE